MTTLSRDGVRANSGALIVTGASGFIGHALLSRLPVEQFSELRILIHRKPTSELPAIRRITSVAGDLLDLETLRALVTPGSTVVQLVHLTTARSEDDNMAAVRNLTAACRDAKIARLILCSTAVVVGGVRGDVITEQTPCRPLTDYERAKYRIEQEMCEAVVGRYEIAILRPTAVFGPGGQNLVSLAQCIQFGNETLNRVHSLLQGRRRMNLVSVHNVAAALGFLATTREAIDQQTYIVSDDDAPANNFRDVEQILRREFSRERAPSGWSVPPAVLSAMLGIRRRSNTNPKRVYSDAKLRALGFVKPWAFDRAVIEFAKWFRTRHASASNASR